MDDEFFFYLAFVIDFAGDVLSGTSSTGIHHFGVLEGWFGEHWWTGRAFVLLVATILVFTPLGFFKRIGTNFACDCEFKHVNVI